MASAHFPEYQGSDLATLRCRSSYQLTDKLWTLLLTLGARLRAVARHTQVRPLSYHLLLGRLHRFRSYSFQPLPPATRTRCKRIIGHVDTFGCCKEMAKCRAYHVLLSSAIPASCHTSTFYLSHTILYTPKIRPLNCQC